MTEGCDLPHPIYPWFGCLRIYTPSRTIACCQSGSRQAGLGQPDPQPDRQPCQSDLVNGKAICKVGLLYYLDDLFPVI